MRNITGFDFVPTLMFQFSRFAFKVHLLEESRAFYLMHLKKLEWFNKLSAEDKSHKALANKNKYKVCLARKIEISFFYPCWARIIT